MTVTAVRWRVVCRPNGEFMVSAEPSGTSVITAASQAGQASASFRELMSRFPTGVAVVTSLDSAGRPHGMTCSSLASVCLQPPTLLVCLRTESSTHRTAQGTGTFAVNLLVDSGRHVAEAFSSRPSGERFRGIGWGLSKAGLPWLCDHVGAAADCTITQSIPCGDHTVLIGHVGNLVVSDGKPLLYGLRKFLPWTDSNQ